MYIFRYFEKEKILKSIFFSLSPIQTTSNAEIITIANPYL